MANVIDVEFVELQPPQLEQIMAESDKAHRECMRAIYIVSAIPVFITAGIWALAVLVQ